MTVIYTDDPALVAGCRECLELVAAQKTRHETPARRVPSAQECRFCDINKEDCPVRIDGDYIPEGATEDC